MKCINELRKKSDKYSQPKELRQKKLIAKNKIEKAVLSDFVNRRQSPNESIRQYADALERLAKHVFQKLPSSELDQHLEKVFTKGLFNAEIKSSAIKKRGKVDARVENLTFKQLVDYLDCKYKARKSLQYTESSTPFDCNSDQLQNDKNRSYHQKRRFKNQSHDQIRHIAQRITYAEHYFNPTPPNTSQISN